MTRLDSLHQWAGASDRPAPILALHGFTGSGADFAALAGRLARQLCAPDLPGHGGADAPVAVAPYRMERVVAGLAALLDSQGLRRPVLLGYSMGGRTALSFAARSPERLGALVLIGASPGLADAGQRAARSLADAALADRIEAEGVAAFQACWSSKPLIATQARIPQPYLGELRRRRLANRAQGLANSLRGMGAGAAPSRWEALAALNVPTLLITGAEDPKYGAIARSMCAQLPAARHVTIAGAGHCAHLERPGASAAAIDDFLSALPRGE